MKYDGNKTEAKFKECKTIFTYENTHTRYCQYNHLLMFYITKYIYTQKYFLFLLYFLYFYIYVY